MQRLTPLLVAPLLLCAALTACSSGGSDEPAGTPSASAEPSAAPAPTVSSAGISAPATSAAATSLVATSSAAATSAAPPAAAAGTITFTGKVSGRMTVRDCGGGIAQLDVDIDGVGTTYAGVIDAHDFTFVAPGSAGYTLAKGSAAPTVTNGGRTFTVHATTLVGILSDDMVTATGSVTCP